MNTVQQIKEMEDELRLSMLNADVALLETLLHEDLMFNLPNGQSLKKADDVNGYKEGLMFVRTLNFLEQDIELFGDVSIVKARVQLQGRYQEVDIDGVFKYLRVWKLFKDGWKVIAGSSHQMDQLEIE